jgi:hypothetical protein
MKVPDLYCGKRLFCGIGEPIALGIGELEARGSAFIEGPIIIGDEQQFPIVSATTMIGPSKNEEATVPIVPGAICGFNHTPYSLSVVGDACVFDNLTVNKQIEVGSHLLAQGEVIARVNGGQHILSLKKNFDIPHPTKEGWRLRHTCPEGPSNDVYFRGKLNNENSIKFPEYWKDFVDLDTITVNITPIGTHQDIIVKEINELEIKLESKDGSLVNCFYHVYGERRDGEKLIPEYQGETPDDYPGNNDEYSVVGWNYDNCRGDE